MMKREMSIEAECVLRPPMSLALADMRASTKLVWSAGCNGECRVRLLSAEIFGSAMALFSRKNYRYSLPFYQLLIASRHLPFTIRYLLLAVVFGSAGASHSHDVAD